MSHRFAVAVGIILSCGSVIAARPTAQTTAAGADVVMGVFEGRTPCGAIANEFTGLPSQNCEKIKWRLTLRRDTTTGAPTRFLYQGTRTERRGAWRIERGGPDKQWTVYRLDSDGAPGTLSLLSVDDGVLLLLDARDHVLVGDASWSYALNRIK